MAWTLEHYREAARALLEPIFVVEVELASPPGRNGRRRKAEVERVPDGAWVSTRVFVPSDRVARLISEARS